MEIHFKVMEHAHDLYIRSIKHVQKAVNVNNIPQKTITKGITYYTKQ